MKKVMILNILTFSVALILLSCTRKKDGEWDDIIKLSSKTAEFSSIGDSVTISTRGSWWWITGISVDGDTDSDFEGVDVLSDNYKITGDCYVVERRNSKTLFIRLDANPGTSLRIVKIFLEAGDYFDGVTITQKAR